MNSISMTEHMDTDLKSHFNQQLGLSTRLKSYVCVKVLILYWEGGDPGFETEGKELGRLFANKDTFNFDVEEFAIPRLKAFLSMRGLITQSLLQLSDSAEKAGGGSLLIIHYGGHGDPNDHHHAHEKKRAVWAADRKGGPTLEWFKIQEDLLDAESHALLLFDCCFAAQAGRGTTHYPGRIDLLAAAAMGVETPMPGERSFTRALIREIKVAFSCKQQVVVSELYQKLFSRKSELAATPIYVPLGEDSTSIRLQHLSAGSLAEIVDDETRGFSILLKVEGQGPLNEAIIEDLVHWLSARTPTAIAKFHVEKVLGTTNYIRDFVKDVQHGDQPLTKGLTQGALKDIIDRGTHTNAIFQRLLERKRPENDSQDDHIPDYLGQLEVENSGFVDLLEQKLLDSSAVSDEAIDDPAAHKFGVADQLRLQKLIRSSQTTDTKFVATAGDVPDASPIEWHEAKVYGPYVNPAEIPALTNRVSLLAQLLGASKRPEFLSLRCLRWQHEPVNYRFVLDFEKPVAAKNEKGGPRTLGFLIKEAKGKLRPTLDERFGIALALARAVRKWHSVGWLHQSISSSNILFFNAKGKDTVDYSHPYLTGFDFARPDSDPSIGRADDVTLNPYRHPDRQGETRKGHRKIHDIYSLGVVLLEIGLWQRAVDIGSLGKGQLSAGSLKDRLLVAAQDRLPHYAGNGYRVSVETCLTSEFSVNLDDENESMLGQSFENKVIDNILQGLDVK